MAQKLGRFDGVYRSQDGLEQNGSNLDLRSVKPGLKRKRAEPGSRLAVAKTNIARAETRPAYIPKPKPYVAPIFVDQTPGRPWYVKAGAFAFMLLGLIAIATWLLLPHSHAVSSGDGLLVYASGAGTTPQTRTYSGAANTFAAAANTVAGQNARNVRVRTSPTKLEAITAYTDASGLLQVMCYDGITWSNEWSISVGGTSTTRRFDIAYETATGDAMVAYSTNSGTNGIAYRVKPGSTGCGTANWATAVNYSTTRTTGIVQWIRLEGSPVSGSNTIGMAWSDANSDLSAAEWTGASWAVAEPTTALETNLEYAAAAGDVQSFDLSFESTTGNMMVAWGVSATIVACTAGNNCIRYSRYTTSWLAATAVPTVNVEGTSIDLSSNPSNNQIVMAAIGNQASRLSAAYWSGTVWTGTASVDGSTATPVAGTKLVATGWLISGATTRSIIAYNDAATTNVGYAAGNAAVFTVQTDFTPATAFANPQKWYDIQTDPLNKDRLMFTLSDNNSDLWAKRLIMNATPTFTWTNADGGTSLEPNLPQATVLPSSFAYWRVIPAASLNQAAYRWFTNLDANDFTAIAENPSANSDKAHAVAVDGANASVYTVGEDLTPSATNSQWRIEKRNTSNGALDTVFGTGGILTNNPSTTLDAPNTVALDTSGGYMFVGGYDSSPGNNQWRIEKRDLTTGALATGFGTSGVLTSNPSTGSDFTKQIVLDVPDGYMYAIGDDNVAGNLGWRIEKRLMTTGALVPSFGTAGVVTSNPSANADEPQDITFDQTNDYLYAAGYDGVTSATNTKWRIEKYNAVSGLICSSVANCAAGIFGTAGVVTSNPGANADQINAIRTDNTYVYVAGTDTSVTTANSQWRIEKYNAATGLICSSVGNCAAGIFGTAGIIQNNPTTLADAPVDLNIDTIGGDMYLAGYRNGATDTSWDTEERSLATGALISGFGTAGIVVSNPSSGDDQPEASALDLTTNSLYTVGRDAATTNDEWRIAKRDLTTGNPTFVTPLANANTAAIAPAQGTPFRLRMLLHANANDLLVSGQTLKLQVATRSGTCDTAFAGETYADVSPTTGAIRYFNNPTPASADATLADPRDPTDSTFTVLPEAYQESNTFTNNIAAVPIGQDGLWDFALIDNSSAAATTYCFRAVDTGGTVIGSYSQIPEITTASTSVTPTLPASLAQKKTDDSVITTGSWVPTTAIKFTANVSTTATSDNLQLCIEKRPVGTAFSNIEDACGPVAAYNGSAVPASVTLTGLTVDTQYHWQARVKNAAGSYSGWSPYGANLESVLDFGLDITAPTGGSVFDGTTAGVDSAFNTGSLTSLSANWSGINAAASGLNFYEYSIGTTSGATDVLGWTNNGTAASVTVNSLNLRTTQAYYFNVRTTDNAGNSSIISSDGQLIQPTLSFSLSTSTLNFLDLNAGNAYTDTANTILTTSTNAYGGYAIRAYLTALLTSTNSATTIPLFTGGSYAAPSAWSGTGFGYSSTDTSIGGIAKFPATGACLGTGTAPCFAPFAIGAPGDIVADHPSGVTGTGTISGEPFTITAQVTTPSTQIAKKYATTIIYTAVPNY